MGSEEKNEALNIGSRLKTPLYPIWLAVVGDHCSLLFSEDRALLRDYRNEYRWVTLQSNVTFYHLLLRNVLTDFTISGFSYITSAVLISNLAQSN